MKDRTYHITRAYLEKIGFALWIPLIPLLLLLLPGALFWQLSEWMGEHANEERGLYNWLVPLNKRSSQRWCLECNKQIPVKHTFCSETCGRAWMDLHPEAKHGEHWAFPVNTQLWCVK